VERVAELAYLGFGSLDLSGVPGRRVLELARWGLAGKAPALRRHPRRRRVATLLATVVYRHVSPTGELRPDGLKLLAGNGKPR